MAEKPFSDTASRIRLIVVVAVMAALAYAWTAYFQARTIRTDRLSELESELTNKNQRVLNGKRADGMLKDWQARSLPADAALAQDLYQSWLTGLVAGASWENAKTDVSTASFARGGVFQTLSVTVSGKGDWNQLVKFLYDFYSAGYFHQVRSLSVKPIENGKLDLTCRIEAAVMPKAKATSALPEATAGRLAWDKLEDYQSAISARNLFVAYTAPPPPPAGLSPIDKFDVAGHAYLTAILQVGERPQAWLNVRTTGQLLKLAAGDNFQVGDLSGKVLQIGHRTMEFEAAGERRTIDLGQNLRAKMN